MRIKEFSYCNKCNKWALLPVGFDETKFETHCPICDNLMYILRGTKPADVRLRTRQQVVPIYVMKTIKKGSL